MLIQHKKLQNKGFFFIEDEGEMLAEMTYIQPSIDKMVIEHTQVDDELRGKNVGFEMVSTAVEYARQHHMKIVPMCPFVRSVFDKKPDYQDVFAEEY